MIRKGRKLWVVKRSEAIHQNVSKILDRKKSSKEIFKDKKLRNKYFLSDFLLGGGKILGGLKLLTTSMSIVSKSLVFYGKYRIMPAVFVAIVDIVNTLACGMLRW